MFIAAHGGTFMNIAHMTEVLLDINVLFHESPAQMETMNTSLKHGFTCITSNRSSEEIINRRSNRFVTNQDF